MNRNFFERTPNDLGKKQVPVWFMRQAGRYHRHYQNLKKTHTFMELCKQPELALEVTLGPIDEFKFDAAILFSDLLFPLEQLGMGLEYNPGPKLSWLLDSPAATSKLKEIEAAREFYDFQGKACSLLREHLPPQKTLLGFVGAPFTLYTYAVEGSHAGALVNSKKGLIDGRFTDFYQVLLPNLMEEMSIQAENGADAICLFDTACGELSPKDYHQFVIPKIKEITKAFKKIHPTKKIIYYSRNTHFSHLDAIEDRNIDVLGVDWRHNLPEVFDRYSDQYMIQGNFDPAWLHLPWSHLESHLNDLWDSMREQNLDRWICGLGHGVLQHTPEENVRLAVEFIHQRFQY